MVELIWPCMNFLDCMKVIYAEYLRKQESTKWLNENVTFIHTRYFTYKFIVIEQLTII